MEIINRTMHVKKHLENQFLYIIGFSILFVVLGRAIPDLYFKYFDKTTYYEISSPMPVDKAYYKPCETVSLSVKRDSTVDIPNADTTVDLLLVLEDKKQKVDVRTIKYHLTRGDDTFLVPLALPCKMPEGIYYFTASIHFKVRDIEKVATAYSQRFYVQEDRPQFDEVDNSN